MMQNFNLFMVLLVMTSKIQNEITQKIVKI